MIFRNRYRKVLALGLAAVITLAFSARDLHHWNDHHHEPVCDAAERHLHEAEGHFECSLCDFVFSPYTVDGSIELLSTDIYLEKLLPLEFLSKLDQHYQNLIRGPPSLV